MASTVSISEFREGATLTRGETTELITQLKGPLLSTLRRDRKDIIELAYLVTQRDDQQYLERIGAQRINSQNKKYRGANKKLQEAGL